jgi:cytochrome b
MQRYIWDPFVRLFHWSLAIAFTVAFYYHVSEWDRMLHVKAGYIAGALILCRIIWGTVATGYANFKTFPPNIVWAVKYFFKLLKGNAKHYVGHNPTGAIVIYAMLGIGLTAVTSGFLVFEDGSIFTDQHIEIYKSIHHYSTWGWLILVALHIVGVITESVIHRDNLILAMITGCKRVCKIKPYTKRQALQPKHEIAYKKTHASKQ